jgi:hypothetical protein
MAIMFIKLNNGEEIIAETYKHKDFLELLEPMTIEYGEQDGRRLIFMTRYNPFLAKKNIQFDRKQVAYMGPVSPEVSEYYSSSVAYCVEVMDSIFKKGIRQASQYTSEQVEEEKMDVLAESLKAKPKQGEPDLDEAQILWSSNTTTIH